MQQLDPRLDAALDSYPLAAIPRGFSGRVMSAIARRKYTFRLDFIDLALPLFLAFFASVTLVAALLGVMLLDPVRRVQLQRTLEFLVSRLPDASNSWILLFPVSGLVVCGLGMLLALTFFFNNPLRSPS